MTFVTAPWFRAGLSVALLGYLASQIDMAETARATLAINPAHLLTAVALVVADRVLMLSRWLLLLRRAGMALPLKSAVWVYLVGSYLGNFLPSGVGADAARAFVLARRTDRGIDAVAMVAIDRYLGLYSLALLAVVGLVFWTGQGDADLRRWSIALAVLVTLGAGVFLWADRLLPRPRPDHVGRSGRGSAAPGAWPTRLGGYRRYPSLLGALTALSLVVQIVRVAQAYVLGEGLGFHVPFSYYLAFMPIGILAILLPVSIGGFGFGQGVIVGLLRPVGVPDAQSLAMSTLYVLMGVLSTLPGALLHFRSRSRGLS